MIMIKINYIKNLMFEFENVSGNKKLDDSFVNDFHIREYIFVKHIILTQVLSNQIDESRLEINH